MRSRASDPMRAGPCFLCGVRPQNGRAGARAGCRVLLAVGNLCSGKEDCEPARKKQRSLAGSPFWNRSISDGGRVRFGGGSAVAGVAPDPTSASEPANATTGGLCHSTKLSRAIGRARTGAEIGLDRPRSGRIPTIDWRERTGG